MTNKKIAVGPSGLPKASVTKPAGEVEPAWVQIPPPAPIPEPRFDFLT